MSQLTTSGNYLIDTIAITRQTGTTVLFNTAGKYSDKDIKINLTVNPGSVKVPATTITAVPQINNTATSNGYVVSFSKTQSISPQVTSAGYISSAEAVAGNVTISGATIIPQSTLSATTIIPAVNTNTTVTIGGGYYPNDRTITVKPMSAGIAANIIVNNAITKTPAISITNSTNMITTASSSTYYFQISRTITAGTVDSTYNVTRAGYIGEANNIEGDSISVTPAVTAATKVFVQAGNVSTSFAGGTVNAAIIDPIRIDLSATDVNNNGLCLTAIGNKSITYAKTAKTEGYIASGTTTSTYAAATATNNYYIKGVTLAKPASGTTSTFYITFPNGPDDNITFNFRVDSNGNVTID